MTTLPPVLSDQLPENLDRQHTVIHRLQTELHRFGYQLVDTPLIEQADLFLIKAGDAAISRLVSFDLSDHTLCLRPEFTAPAARLYIDQLMDSPGAARLQFAGSILQYESLHHSQLRQQYAIGAELINEHSPTADAELIALVSRMLTACGITGWQLVIGHSGLIERFLDRYNLNRAMRRFVLSWLHALRTRPNGLGEALAALETELGAAINPADSPAMDALADTESALRALVQASPQRGPTGGRTSEEIARRLLSKQQHSDQQQHVREALTDLHDLFQHATAPASLRSHATTPTMRAIADELAATFDLLEAYGLPASAINFDLSFTRNLDYYTGIVFEYRTPLTPSQPEGLLLAGGGRYDELIRLLGAPHDVPAVGFMMDLDHILAAIPAPDRQTSQAQPHLLLEAQQPADVVPLIKLASQLRAEGYNVTTNLSQQAQAAIEPPYTHRLSLNSPDQLCLSQPSGEALTLPFDDPPALYRALEANHD